MSVSRRSFLRSVGAAAVAGGVGTLAYGRFGATGAGRPKALVAGSLLRFAKRISGAAVEAHGSTAARRLLLNGMRDPDAVALADPRLFDGVRDRVTLFATNALVVTYAPDSAYAADLRRDWRRTVGQEGIRLGRTDPTRDPLGYRTVLALRLTEAAGGPRSDRVLEKATVFRETDLLNVVEGGRIDAAFTYRNMAVQRDLPFVELPDAIDLSNPDYADRYGTAAVTVGSETIRGAPIRYAAAATTSDGESWVESLVTAGDSLRETGFVVPSDYPIRGARPSA